MRLLFGLKEPVDRRTYALVGFVLMALKYVVDALVVWIVAEVFWTPLDYLSPIFVLRQEKLGAVSPAFQLVMASWTLPFLWIGVSMTMRRAYDAGLTAWAGLVFFVPVLNYLLMLWLCLLPTVRREPRVDPLHADEPLPETAVHDSLRAALLAILVSVIGTAFAVVVCVYGVRSYNMALFAGAPFFLGLVAGYLYNREERRGVAGKVGDAGLSILMSLAANLLCALEGAICIAMAAPPAAVVSLFGALIGRGIALIGKEPAYPGLLAILALPGLAALEDRVTEPARYEVVTSIEIDAPRDEVWRNVVSFSELPEPSWLLFRLGIAYPRRAVIDGEGVGAVRRCEFSTGAFVEPITVWDEPARLAFDVVAQPPPMHEWSPYRNVHPPHLDGAFRSTAGEFRLIALPDGRTRLEGSTWYELDLHPTWYWRLWADFLVHRIHGRVLEHIARETEG
ncbi:MAG: hypothetical protein O7B99_06435 [Planctomycetota bacterium]|nr:hypothetical protein [Planctomycetota bacterium]